MHGSVAFRVNVWGYIPSCTKISDDDIKNVPLKLKAKKVIKTKYSEYLVEYAYLIALQFRMILLLM